MLLRYQELDNTAAAIERRAAGQGHWPWHRWQLVKNEMLKYELGVCCLGQQQVGLLRVPEKKS
jgi:hypothetical protein